MDFFIPEKLFVARVAVSSESVKGFVVPIIKGISSRKATVVKNTDVKNALPAIELDNTFEAGYSLLTLNTGRYRHSNDEWVILHPLGFEISMPAGNVLELVCSCQINEGVITTPLRWITDGKNLLLVPEHSPQYKKVKTQKEAETFIPLKNVPVGSVVKLKNGSKTRYLGSCYLLPTSAVQYNKQPKDCKAVKRFIFTAPLNMPLKWNTLQLVSATPEILEILEPADGSITSASVMGIINDAKQNTNIYHNYKNSFAAVHSKPFTLADCSLTKRPYEVSDIYSLAGRYNSSRVNLFAVTDRKSVV